MSTGFSDANSPIAHHDVTPDSCFSSSHLRSHPSDLWSKPWQEVGRNFKSALTLQTSILSAKHGINARLKAFLEENTSLLRAAGNSRGNGISGQEFSSAQLLCTCVPPGRESCRQLQTCTGHSSLRLNCAEQQHCELGSMVLRGAFPHLGASHSNLQLPCKLSTYCSGLEDDDAFSKRH